MGLLDKIKGDDEQEEVELRPDGGGYSRLEKEVKNNIADSSSSSDDEEEEVEMSSSGGFLPGMGSDTSSEASSSSSSTSTNNRDVAEKLDRVIAQNKKIIKLLKKNKDSGTGADSVW